MAGKDCDCGKTKTVGVGADDPPDTERDLPVPFYPVNVTESWDACLANARETLGLAPGEGTAKTLIDSLCTALTMCRAEKQVLATEVDKAAARLDECQDELSDCYGQEVDNDFEEEEEETDDGLSTTTTVHGEEIPSLQALSKTRAALRESELRQGSSVQQPGRAPGSAERMRADRVGVLRSGHAGARVRPVVNERLRDGASASGHGLPVLHQRASVQPAVAGHSAEPVHGQRDDRPNVRGAAVSNYSPGPGSRPVRHEGQLYRSGKLDPAVQFFLRGKLVRGDSQAPEESGGVPPAKPGST